MGWKLVSETPGSGAIPGSRGGSAALSGLSLSRTSGCTMAIGLAALVDEEEISDRLLLRIQR